MSKCEKLSKLTLVVALVCDIGPYSILLQSAFETLLNPIYCHHLHVIVHKLSPSNASKATNIHPCFHWGPINF
jgi:hypothetical protein